MDSLVLETVIGLLFVFAAFSSVVSMLTEMISRFLGLRGEYLLRGLRTLLDGGGKFALPWLDILRSTTRAPTPRPTSPRIRWSPSCSRRGCCPRCPQPPRRAGSR